MDAVRAVDVRVPGRAEHRPVAGGRAPVAVAGRVVGVVGLHLDDAPADPVHEQRAAHQLRRDVVHAPREEVAREHD